MVVDYDEEHGQKAINDVLHMNPCSGPQNNVD